MPVNDGSNISIAGPRGGLTTTDPFQQASKLFSAMRRASGGSGGTNAAVAASLGLPPNAEIDWMLDPQSGTYVPVVGGTDELRKHNLEAAKQRRAIEAINSEKGAGIRAKLEGFGGMSAEKQASILNDIRTNDIPKLSKDAQVDGSDLITYGLADYSRMQKENAANVAKTGTGDILWDSLRIGARNFMDSVADIFSDSNEQLARANLRQQYIRDIQDNNAFLRNRALQQQEGAGFLDRFGWGELAATTGEFLAENAPVLAATALTGGAAGLAARGLGAAAANVGRASMLGSAIGGGLTGAPTQLGSAINEIAADNKLTEDQKLQALDEAYAPSLKAGAALGAVVMPFGQYISRGIGSGLARAGVGNSNVAKMVRSRRAGEALPTGTNNWDEAMAMARRNDILAENEAIANQRLYRGMLGRRLRDSAIEGSLLSGASQMATNAAVGNSLMENVGPATIGGAIGGALFTPFNRRTAMGVPDDVIGQRTAERQKLVDLFAARNAARGGEARSLDDQTIGAMEAWDALAGARGADVLSNATPMTPAQREAYLRQQSYDDLLLNRMMAHEQAMQARANNFGFDDIAADPFRGYGAPVPFGDRTATTGPRIIDRLSRDSQFNADWNRIAAERAAQSAAAREAALRTDFVQRSIFDVMPEPIPYTPPNRVTRSVFTPEERIAQEWANMERARAAANLARQARTYPALYTPSGLVPVAPEPTPEFVRAQVERQYGPMTGSPYGVPSLDITRPVGALPLAAPRAIGEDPSRNRWEGGAIPTEPYFAPGSALPRGTGNNVADALWVGPRPSIMDIPAAQSIATERARRYPTMPDEFRPYDIIADDPEVLRAVAESQNQPIVTPDMRSPEETAFGEEWFNAAQQNRANARAAGMRRLPALYENRGMVPVDSGPTPEFVRAQVERQYGPMTGSPYGVPSLDITRPVGALPPAAPRAIGEDPSRNRWEGGAIPAEENPNDIRQQVVDTLAALRERRNNTELRNERLINTGIAQEYYFNRVRDQQFRRDFTIYEGEVLLENNPGVLPTNNYLPENVAAVVENLGEPRIAETMLDGTPATDQRPKPQRPYTKAITYVSSDDALRKFTGKLRGRESMIPRDVREEQMGWMNDILAAGTGKGRISAQGVLAKDVRDTLDKIVDAQTVDSAMRLDELLLTRLRGSEDTSLFNRAQRAAMQYVRNRIYANMDDYAYQNKLGRYGEIDANTPENTDPTGGGGSPTSGMGGTESAGAEPTVDSNLSNDSGRPADTAGVSEATAGQLPDSTATDSAAVEERGDAGTETPDSGKDTTLEGDSAATSAQQQAADGKRDTGDAARVDAATNPRTGSDRVEGSSEQGDDRNAADTGSNAQSGSRTEPEDGEFIDASVEEDPSMYRSHTNEQTTTTAEQTPTVEPKGLSSAEEIAARQTNPDIVPTQGVDPESNEALAWAAQQEGNRTHVEDDNPADTGSTVDYGNDNLTLLIGNAAIYKANHIRSDTSKLQIDANADGAISGRSVKVFPDSIRITVAKPDENENIAPPVIWLITRTGHTAWDTQDIGINVFVGTHIRNEKTGTSTFKYEMNSSTDENNRQFAKGITITNEIHDKNIISKSSDELEDGYEYAYIHLGNADEMIKHIPNNDSLHLIIDVKQHLDESTNRNFTFDAYISRNELLSPATRNTASNSLLDAADAKPTEQNTAAAQKVVKESGSVDARGAFLEDAAPANVTITAKDSLKNNAKKRLRKAAAQNLPQLPIDTPAPTTESPSVFSERFSRTIADMEQQYTRNGHSLDNFIKGAASSGASAKRIITKRNASDASWREDLRDDMAETAARLGIMRSTGLFGEVKRGSPLARKEEFFANNNIPLIEPNSEMAQHLKEYFGAMPARERKITQAIDYVLRDPTAQKMDIINHPERSVC